MKTNFNKEISQECKNIIQYSLKAEKIFDNLLESFDEVSKGLSNISKALLFQSNSLQDLLELSTLIKSNNTTILFGLLSQNDQEVSDVMNSICKQNAMLKESFSYFKQDFDNLTKFTLKVEDRIRTYEIDRDKLWEWKNEHYKMSDYANWELDNCKIPIKELISNKKLAFLHMNKKVK